MWPEPARLRPHDPLNVVFDGNSLVQGIGASSGNHVEVASGTTLPGQVAALLARRFTNLTVWNEGISAQTWDDMRLPGGAGIGNGPGDVDARYDPARTNLLVVWETTNAIFNVNRSAESTIAAAQDYVTARLALHPGWRILTMSTLPRQILGDGTNGGSQSVIDERNQRMLQVDHAIRDNIRSWGGRGQIDVRCVGSPFAIADYTPAGFAGNDALWFEAQGQRVHLLNAGYAILAGLVARAVCNMAAR